MGARGKIPIHGFVEGDVLGVLVLADADASVDALAQQLLAAAAPRVKAFQNARVLWQGRPLDREQTLHQCGLPPLSRVDVVHAGGERGA